MNACECVHTLTPPNCDDGCEYTTDTYNEANCECDNILAIPNCDDNCEFTVDTFNEMSCECENVLNIPSCDDGCENTIDSYNESSCECENILSTPNCDDDCEYTTDSYNEINCECDNILTIPNCDDNCEFTVDTFNEMSCECENVLNVPSCDDECENTIDSFNQSSCECENILSTPNCDDDCEYTVDIYNEAICACENILTIPVCDDNDCTNGLEIWNEENCTCETTPIDCSNSSTSVVSCDDNDPSTIDDQQTILDCDNSICIPCMGTLVDCSNGQTTVMPCDDGDDCTNNDFEIVLDFDGSICVPCTGDFTLSNEQLLPMDDQYEVDFGKLLNEDVSINDESEITQDISNNLISNPNSGTIEFNEDGTFQYQPTDPLSNSDSFTYQICVVNCPDICATANVNLVITLDDIIIPNAISPNSDGLNDTWIIPGLLQRDIREMTIINRWGIVLYNTKSYENDWNGNNMKGKPLPEGTYYYYLNMGVDFGTRQGLITIIR